MLDKIRELFKNKNTFVKIMILMTILTGLAETFVYYQDKGYEWYYLLALGLVNGVRMFNFNSSMKAVDVLSKMSSDTEWYQQLIHNLFFIFHIIAPLLLIVLVYSFANYLLNNKLSFLLASKNEKLLIIGYNKYTKAIIKNSAKDKQVILLYSTNLSEADKVFLRKNNVIYRQYESSDFASKEKRKELFAWTTSKKIKRIILFETDELLNYSNYIAIDGYIRAEDQKGRFEGSRIDCSYEQSSTEALIYDYYSRIQKGEKKYKLSTFSIPMLRSQGALDECPIVDKGSGKEVHLLIIGFGRMGERFLKRAINQSVNSPDGKIMVDIIDRNNKDALWFFKNINPKYYDEKEQKIHIGGSEGHRVADGELRICFHEMDVRDTSFITELGDDLMKSYTYIAVCLDSPELSLGCMQSLKQYYYEQTEQPEQSEREKMPKTIVRIDSEYNFEKLKGENIFIMPGIDEILTLDNIEHSDLQKISEKIHENDIDGEQDETSFFNEARTYRLLHVKVKEDIISNLSNEEKREIYSLIKDIRPGSKDRREIDEFIQKVRNSDELKMLGAIEHRRWAYHKILTGYSYSKGKRSDFRRTARHLVTFDNLIEDNDLNNRLADDYKDWKIILEKEDYQKVIKEIS